MWPRMTTFSSGYFFRVSTTWFRMAWAEPSSRSLLVWNDAPVSWNEMALVRLTPNILNGVLDSEPSANRMVNWYW